MTFKYHWSSKVAPIESYKVYDFLGIVYSNLSVSSRTVFEKFDVKQSNDLEIPPRSSTVASRESCRVAMYVCKMFEDSE